MNTRRGKKARGLISRFDFIETFNACETPASNQAAAQLAKRFDIPGTGGSDSHKEDCIGLGYTMIEADIRNETDFIHAICSDVTICSGGEQYMHTTKQKIGRANDLLIYSFWFYNKLLALFRRHKRKGELSHLFL